MKVSVQSSLALRFDWLKMMNQKKHSLDQSELELILSLSKAANFSPVCWKSISADEAAYKAAVFCSCFSLVLDLLDPNSFYSRTGSSPRYFPLDLLLLPVSTNRDSGLPLLGAVPWSVQG